MHTSRQAPRGRVPQFAVLRAYAGRHQGQVAMPAKQGHAPATVRTCQRKRRAGAVASKGVPLAQQPRETISPLGGRAWQVVCTTTGHVSANGLDAAPAAVRMHSCKTCTPAPAPNACACVHACAHNNGQQERKCCGGDPAAMPPRPMPKWVGGGGCISICIMAVPATCGVRAMGEIDGQAAVRTCPSLPHQVRV